MPQETDAIPSDQVPPKEREDAGRGREQRSRLAYLALVAMLVPLVVSAIALAVDVGNRYVPTADFAYTELLTRDVGHHQVLVGLYSRGDWNHPGPALFYLLAVPYRLVGGASIGIDIGALLINGVAVVGMALIARRRGGNPLMLFTLLGIAVLGHALGADFMHNPWNPYITVLPFGLMVLLSWSMTCRDTWALPVGAGVATFLAQTHVGYVALAVPLLVWGAVWLVPLARRGSAQRREVLFASAIAVVVLAVMWFPPLLDQLLHSPGNLRNIAHYFLHPDEATHSLAQGYRVVTGELGLPPEWISGARKPFGFNGEHLFAHSAPPPVLLIPFALAAFVLWRKGGSDARRLIATLLVAMAVGVFAVMRTIGQLSAYRLRWTWMLATLAGVIVLWGAWTWLTTRSSARGARWLVVLAAVGVGVLATMSSVDAARVGVPQRHDTRVMAALIPPSANALPPGNGDVLVRYTSNETRYFAPGIVLGLERRGVAARVDPDPAQRYGAHRIHRGAPVRAVLTLVSGTDVLAQHPGQLVAFWGDRPRPALTRALEKLASLQADAAAGRITQKQLVAGLLKARADAVAMFMETS